MKLSKLQRRKRIRNRIRKSINGIAAKPRASVYRSNNQIYVQLVDDRNGNTLLAVSSKDASIDSKLNNVDKAKAVGTLLASKASEAGIENIVFDRGGNLYHGRVKALADGAREGGLNF